jgi:hypothetical protein
MRDANELDLAVLAKIRGGGLNRIMVVTQQKSETADDSDLSPFSAALGGAIKGAVSGAS